MAEPLINITRKQAMTFACFLVLYEFLTYIANDMIMPGMITVIRSFHAPESNIATSLTLYILGGASLQLILGPLSDAYGRRCLMLLGSGLFFLFTVLIACSSSMNQFLIARFFEGMGLCFIGVIGYATIQEIFDEMDAIRLIAIMANAAILAPLLGPLLGALIIYYSTWRIVFVLVALFALLAFWGLWRYMPESIGKIKKDKSVVPKTKFSLKLVFNNYWSLLTHPIFCFSIISLGLASIPCLVWIALSPVIMITEAKLTVIQYGLWQLPVFGSTILGNWCLHRLTYHYDMKGLVYLGSGILVFGLLLTALLPLIFGNNYLCLLPGIIIYFFSISIINAPLNRFCLYVTPVSKGTVSALVSLSTLIIEAIGIEIGSMLYQNHKNLYLGLYCTFIAILVLLFVGLTFKNQTLKPSEGSTNT